ncbi:MAG: ferrochelatase [Isosphaeraceae bacterium]|jgi:ferrochelatase|nr:MAG: ferrochelatase [Isosphaeraceae bacterium]
MSTFVTPSTLPSTTAPNPAGYDALLVVSFGGPEGPDDVMPFLENVTRGRNIPRERLLEVAEHYHHFGGKSPINDQVRELLAALRPELDRRGIGLPLYWGNRNWHPLLADTVRAMTAAGHRRALAVVLAAYSSYSSCRQYRENVSGAADAAGPEAPQFDKMRVFYNHPDFVAANADRVREAIAALPESARGRFHMAFTAHSIPASMAAGCDYEKQLTETSRLVAEELGLPRERWKLVYQSRSGRPEDPWLEPDILDHIDALHAQGVRDLVIAPIGFLSDHMEILYDLDHEARQRCAERGLRMVRAATVGTHPRFVAMLGELIAERMAGSAVRRAIGQYPANHDVCPVGCCPAPGRPART